MPNTAKKYPGRTFVHSKFSTMFLQEHSKHFAFPQSHSEAHGCESDAGSDSPTLAQDRKKCSLRNTSNLPKATKVSQRSFRNIRSIRWRLRVPSLYATSRCRCSVCSCRNIRDYPSAHPSGFPPGRNGERSCCFASLLGREPGREPFCTNTSCSRNNHCSNVPAGTLNLFCTQIR
jgi:hypothetical protein